MANTSLQSRTLQYVRITGELLKRAQQDAQEKQAAAVALAKPIQDAVAALSAIEYIQPDQTAKVAEALASSPLAAVELLRNFAQRVQTEKSASLGIGVKSASAAAAEPAAIGPVDARITDFDQTQAGREFREGFLGARR